MYSKALEPKVDKMFYDICQKASEIIANATSARMAGDSIAAIVASETAARSKTMLSDMYAALSKQVIDSIPDVAKQNRFYEANLRQEIFDKYNFEIPAGGIDFKEANRAYASLAAGAVPALIGGTLILALSLSSTVVPLVLVIAASVATFCASYFAVTPNLNKKNFKVAIDKYLADMKKDFISWFNEIESYFNKRAKEITTAVE